MKSRILFVIMLFSFSNVNCFFSFFLKEKKGLKIQSKSYYHGTSEGPYSVYVILTNYFDYPVVISPESIDEPILPIEKQYNTKKAAFFLMGLVAVGGFYEAFIEKKTLGFDSKLGAFSGYLICGGLFTAGLTIYLNWLDRRKERLLLKDQIIIEPRATITKLIKIKKGQKKSIYNSESRFCGFQEYMNFKVYNEDGSRVVSQYDIPLRK